MFIITLIIIIILFLLFHIAKFFWKKSEGFIDFGIAQRRHVRLSHTGSNDKSLKERGF
jgi:Na+/proline symporter